MSVEPMSPEAPGTATGWAWAASSIFVVWNLSTFDNARPGVFSPLQDLGSAFGADGHNVFMIKMNYWLGL